MSEFHHQNQDAKTASPEASRQRFAENVKNLLARRNVGKMMLKKEELETMFGYTLEQGLSTDLSKYFFLETLKNGTIWLGKKQHPVKRRTR